MKSLIVEDDFTSRLLMQKMLMPFGESHVAVNGAEALTAFYRAMHENEPYDLVCLDIMMPELDGQEVLQQIRAIEKEKGVLLGDGTRVIMTTALADMENKVTAFRENCDAYLVKPISKAHLLEQLISLKLID